MASRFQDKEKRDPGRLKLDWVVPHWFYSIKKSDFCTMFPMNTVYRLLRIYHLAGGLSQAYSIADCNLLPQESAKPYASSSIELSICESVGLVQDVTKFKVQFSFWPVTR